MALDDLIGTNIHNQEYIPPTGNQGVFPPGGGLGNYIERQPPLMSIDGGLNPPHFDRPMPITPPNFIGIQPQPPMFGRLQPMPQPDYSGQFENFGETLGGFSEQLTGFGDQMTG